MHLFLHLSTAKDMVIASSLHLSTALPLIAVPLRSEMARVVLLLPNGSHQPLLSQDYNPACFVFFIKHKKYYGFYGPIWNRIFLNWIYLFIMYLFVTQSFLIAQLLIVGRTQLKKKKAKQLLPFKKTSDSFHLILWDIFITFILFFFSCSYSCWPIKHVSSRRWTYYWASVKFNVSL